MKVVVTGGGGYVGSVLVRELLSYDCEVVAMDRFFFGTEPLDALATNHKLSLVKKDIRDADVADFKGVDAVCDLAALSNDPSCEIDPNLTYEINHKGRSRVARLAKEAGVTRYLLSSSCSLYGTGGAALLDETAPTAPLSAYADSTLKAEQDVFALADDSFCATALRNATVFGLSPRMRFDLVINLMTLHAVEKGMITVTGGGRQWRPLVHVRDMARAFRAVIQAPTQSVSGEIFNIGHISLPILSLAYIVRETIPFPVQVHVAPDDSDKRNYNVSFKKACDVLGFEPEISIEDGVREIYDALKLGRVECTPQTKTVEWYRGILDAKALIEVVELNGRIL